MCVVIDINAVACVFDHSTKDHQNFEKIENWIRNGKGKIVYGGTKYLKELERTKYVRLFNLLRDQRKVVIINSDEVDKLCNDLTEQIQHPDFDDPHLVAIVSASRVQLVCTKDKRAMPFLKDKSLYPKGCKKPRIFTGTKNNQKMVLDSFLAPCCK